MSNDDIRLDIQANINPIFQKPLAADPNQTKFSAQLELRPVFQKWLSTDLKFKDPLSADIHFTDQSLRTEQARLQNTVLQSLKDIQIQLRGPSNPAMLLKDINDLLKNTPIKLLDRDTKIDKQAITAYIRRYIAELEAAIKQAPPVIQAKLQLVVNSLRDELRTVQATINVGLEPDTTNLRASFDKVTATLSQGFAQSVDSLVQSFATKVSDELGKPIPLKIDSEKVLTDLKNTLAQFQQSAPDFLSGSIQAGTAAVSQAQSGSPQSADVFTTQLLALSKELEAAKDLLTDPLVNLAQTIQTQIGQLTSLPDYSLTFDVLTDYVQKAGLEFAHLLPAITSFRALIDNTQRQTAQPSESGTTVSSPLPLTPNALDPILTKIQELLSPFGGYGQDISNAIQKFGDGQTSLQELTDTLSEFATNTQKNSGAMAVPELKEVVGKIKEFTSAQQAPAGSQQTPPTPEETKSIADNVQRLTDEATNGNSLDTHDHTAEALLNSAITTLNAIHAHLIANLNVQLSTINTGGGNASLANPNLFASRNTDDYVAGWTEIKKGTTRLADALEAGVFNVGARAVNTGTLSTTLGVDERRTSMAVSAGVEQNKAINLSVVETALGSLSTMTGDFAADMDALIASTSNAVQKGTLQAFKDNIELAAGSAGIGTSNLMDYARAVINADAQIKTQSDRYDTIAESVAEINTLFDDTNAILTEAQAKMKEYQDAGIAIPEALLTSFQTALQQQKAMSATYGDEIHLLLLEFQDEAKTSKALKDTALANATATAAPGTSQADIQIAANREYERLQSEWIDQMERLVSAIETGASATITAADRFGRHDNTGQEAVTIGASPINPTNMRAEALATNRAIDQAANDGNWDAMINRVAELQDVFGSLSSTITGFGSALSGISNLLPQEFGQALNNLSSEVGQAQRNYKDIQETGKMMSSAGKTLSDTLGKSGGTVGRVASAIGSGMQSVGPLLSRLAGPLTGIIVAAKGVQVALAEIAVFRDIQTKNAEMSRMLTASQGIDKRLTLQTDLTSLAQARAQSADKVVGQSRTHAEQSAQNLLSGTSGVAAQQERFIELETERLKLAERNALLAKETEQQRVRSEKELQQAQEQRHQKSQLSTQKGWTGSGMIDGAGNVVSTTGTGQAVGGTAGTVAGGIGGAAAGGYAGAATGAFIGGLIGSIIPVLGTAVGATAGAWIGGIAGTAAGGYLGGSGGNALGQGAGSMFDPVAEQSKKWKDELRSFNTAAWGFGGGERNELRQKNVQKSVDEYNKELSGVEAEKFKQLNAGLDAVTSGVKAFGDVLPTEQLRQFQESAQQATSANLQFAQTTAALEQLNRTANMSDEQRAKEAKGETKRGWMWDTETSPVKVFIVS